MIDPTGHRLCNPIGTCFIHRRIWQALLLIFLFSLPGFSRAQNAPVSTIASVVSPGNTAVVPVTVSDFISMRSFLLEIHYNSSIAHADSVVPDGSLAGMFDYNVATSGVVKIGWSTYPSLTIPGSPVILNLYFSKITAGTTDLDWYDVGYTCYYQDSEHGILNDLPTSTYYIPGSVTFGVPLVADFSANNTAPPRNTTVQFTDLTAGNPTSWAWSFDRATVTYVNGTSASSPNPQVQFTDGGPYTVTLVASNTSGSSTQVKTGYIWAGSPGLWNGSASTSWTLTSNWDDWRMPVASTDVTVPPLAANWPTYTGDLTLGSACKSITLDGAAECTVTGNFTINPGAALTFTGTGTFHAGGDWTNAGTFLAGSGTVEFYGTGPGSILGAGSPTVINVFHHLKASKTGTDLTILPDIVIEGNVEINP